MRASKLEFGTRPVEDIEELIYALDQALAQAFQSKI